MKNKVIIILGVLIIFLFVVKNSFANPVDEEEFSLLLQNNSDVEILKRDIFNYIDLVDDNIIPNSSYVMSNKLNENYDFLTKFAISFILDNDKYFDIVSLDNYVYKDEYGREFRTDKYIDINTIYEITYQVFGVSYYYILNDYLKIENDLVPLIQIDEYDFNMELDKIIDIDILDNYYDVTVKYKDIDLDYIYRFELLDNRLIINNLSVGGVE